MLSLNKNILFFLGASFSFFAWIFMASPGSAYTFKTKRIPADTSKKVKKSKTPDYTPEDRYGDPYSNPPSKSPFILPLPSNVDVILDDSLDSYTIEEKIGDMDFRPASTMTFQEYSRYKNQEMMKNYWKNKGAGDTSVTSKTDNESLIKFKISNSGRSGIFGSDFVDIRPTGLVTLDFAGKWQRVNNPNIPVRQQRQGQFDFDQSISMNVIGKIGEKLKLSVNWDTKAAFEFQNNLKLEFTGFEEDIIQKIEAGNVSFPLNSALISGAQNLFGVKTKLQFGRLTTTTVFSSQRGKVDEIKISGGSQSREFEIRADNYDDYRHFFIGHFFRDNYEKSLQALPAVLSGVKITRIEVYITNRTNNTQALRNMVAYTDLGEPDPSKTYTNHSKAGIPFSYPNSNEANLLFDLIKNERDSDLISNSLKNSYNLVKGSDFEIIDRARKLLPTEFKFNTDLGYITLNTPLRSDEVLGVAYEYTYNGKSYKVGELNGDYQNIADNEVIILKLLKPSTIKTRLPTWDLMMKNIYQLGASQVTRENFQLRVVYKNDLSGLDLPNLQEGVNTANIPLLRLTGLDRLNPNNDPSPDGNFDFVEEITVDTRNGRIIFPVLEPFGSNLYPKFDPVSEAMLIRKYVFSELYDSTKSDAQQIASKNKYFIKGRYQSGSSSEIILPGINIAPGSVTVLAGSTQLIEGQDYDIDYNLGRLKIKNQGVLASNKEITIRFEKQDFINFRRKSFIGTRMDYKINNDFWLGGTLLHQMESPNISRVNIGDEPSKNTIVGLDANYKADSRLLTKAVDKLPIIQTKAISTINFSGEGAGLFPGYPKLLDKSIEENGTSYLDDFEGAETPYDLTRTPTKWRLGSTPLRIPDSQIDGLDYAYRRAKLSWYNIDNGFYNGNQTDFEDFNKDTIGQNYIKNFFVKQIVPQDIFPNRDPQQIVTPEPVLDFAYYPGERGPYNFNPDTNNFKATATQNWAGVTREIRNDIDFDNANIQYIEFWMMDPFMNSRFGKIPLGMDESTWQTVTTGGQLYFNLGSISEDVLKDGKHAFENGLPVTGTDGSTPTVWGKVTTQQFLTNAFANEDDARPKQDVGLDGLNNAEERAFFPAPYNDPSMVDPAADDFKHYLDSGLKGTGILERYKNFNGLENNSPVNTGGGFTPSNSMLPDNEDINLNNTLDDLDEYYEYKVEINKPNFVVGQNHIVDSRVDNGVSWYQFRIPIREPDSVVGAINGFKSIRFMRMYMTGFANPVVLRMVQFQLVANQWRVYIPDDINPPSGGLGQEPSGAILNVSTVNIEENGQGDAQNSPYVLPPGITRDQDAISQTSRRLNEQSLQLCINELQDGKAEAAYKNVNFNLINYEKIKMFIHAESDDPATKSGDMHAFFRVGTDFTENYYEIAVPLTITPNGNNNDVDIWPKENMIEVNITDLTATKGERNKQGRNKMFPFSKTMPDGKIITVVGNPDLTTSQVMMLGLRNPKTPDKRPLSVCIWVNELRVTGFNQNPAYAATARMNVKLADLATINGSVKYTTAGWGSLDQKVSQRERDNTTEWGVSSNIALDKFIPEKLGIRLPMYVSFDQRLVTPRYDPLDPDMRLKNSLENINDPEKKEIYKLFVLDRTTRRSINFTNVQKVKTNKEAKKHIYDIENLAFTTAYSETRRTSSTLKDYNQKYYKGEVVYAYSTNAKNYEPFKKVSWLKSPYLKGLRDFNFTPMPGTLSFRGSLDRRLTRTQYYEGNPIYGEFIQAPLFEKAFTFTRNYGLNWALAKSLALDYKANAFAVIDEPNRDPTFEKENYRDSLMSNLLRLGRMKNFDQRLDLTYKIPLDKIPLFDWLNADAKYGGGYAWTSGALGLRDTLGNIIQNSQTTGFTGRVNMEKLYNKSKFLKAINTPPPPVRPGAKPPVKAPAKDTTKITLPKKELKGLKSSLRAVMSIKSINFNYDITRATALPGFIPIAKYAGMPSVSNSMDLFPFVFGSQDPYIRQTATDNDWLSKSRSLNSPFTQSRITNFTARTALEPIKDFKIQLDVVRKKSTNYQELYRIDSTLTRHVSESPSRTGSLTLSIISIRTAFAGKAKGSEDPNSSATFEAFQSYREIMRNRIQNDLQSPGSLDTNSQNLLIPAFLAAYTKRDPQKAGMSAYPQIPMPNWRIDYAGLTKIKKIRDIFPSMTISHGYISTYAIGNYASSLLYGSDLINPFTDISDDPIPVVTNANGSFVPVYIVDQVTITEAFNPLLGVNFRTKGKITGRLEFKRARMLTLSMVNSEIQETRSNDLVIGIGYIKTGFQFFKFPPLKNELNSKLDITISDRKTVQRKFDEPGTVTAGNLNIQIRPNVTYRVSSRVDLMFYFERIVNAPKISSSFKNSSTRFGAQLRFTLS